MIYITIIIIVLICYLEKRYVNHSTILSPWIINNLIWLAVSIALITNSQYFHPFRGDFKISLLLWTIGFNAFSCLSYKLKIHKNKQRKYTSIFIQRDLHNNLFNVLLCISLFGTLLFVYKGLQNIEAITVNIMSDFRGNANEGNLDFGILNRIQIFNQCLLIVSFYYYKILNKYKILYIIIANLLVSIIIAEKGSMLYLVTVIIYFMYRYKKISIKNILYTSFATLLLFWLINLSRSIATGEYSGLTHFLSLYILSPSAAFDHLHPEVGKYFGQFTFPPFYIFYNLLYGTHYPIVTKLKDFVDVPMHTNVYTIFQPFYQDWGIWGVFVFACLFGLFCGYIYKKSFQNTLVFKWYYVHVYYVVLTGFFQDNFFISLSESVQLLVMFYVISKFVSYNRVLKQKSL